MTESPSSRTQTKKSGPLTGIRVLEISRKCSYYCGKLFADLGAEVILVEPPRTGIPLRWNSPFIGDCEDKEYGIPHAYMNANKRSITLDLDTPEGQGIFLRLIPSVDLILEDSKPGWMGDRGMDYAALRSINPAVVMSSVTPFGQTGPYASYDATDLTLLAHGGLLNLMGSPDGTPTQAAGEQAYGMACMYAAVGSMVALLEAESSGSGQHVDVSIQESVLMALENAAQLYDLEGTVRTRTGAAQRYAGAGTFRCIDGYVYVFAGGMAAGRFWGNLVRWLEEEQVVDAGSLNDSAWKNPEYVHSEAAKRQFERIFSGFALSRTKDDLFREAQARRIPLCPVNTPADVSRSRQLAARNFFAATLHGPSGRVLRMPGAPYKLSSSPWELRHSAPLLGQDNLAIYSEIKLSRDEQRQLAVEGII